jgi:hypothetical protein
MQDSLAYTVEPASSGVWVVHAAESDTRSVTLRFESQRALAPGTKVVLTFGGVRMPNIVGELERASFIFQDRYDEKIDVFLGVGPTLVLTNELAPVFVGAPFVGSMLEDDVSAVDRTVLTVEAVDPDAVPGVAMVFSIVSQSPAGDGAGIGTFAIDPTTGEPSVSGTVDRERMASASSHFTIVVQVAEMSAPFLSRNTTVVVNIEDANDSAPTFVYEGAEASEHGYWFAVDENVTAGALVGTVRAVDADVRSSSLNYSWVPAPGSPSNETEALLSLDAFTGKITVATSAGLADAGPVLRYEALAMDAGGLSTAAAVSVFVLDASVLATITLESTGAANETVGLDVVAAALSAAMGAQRAAVLVGVDRLASGALEVAYYVVNFGVSADGDRTVGILSKSAVELEMATPAAMDLLSASSGGALNVVGEDSTSGGAGDATSSKSEEEMIGAVAGAGAFLILIVSLIGVVVMKHRPADDGSKYIYSHSNADAVSGMVVQMPQSAYIDVAGDPRSSMFGPVGGRVASSMISGLTFDDQGLARNSLVAGAAGERSSTAYLFDASGQPRASMLPPRPSYAAPAPPPASSKKKGSPSEAVVSGLSRQESVGYLDLGSPMSAANTMYAGDDDFFNSFHDEAAATNGGPNAAPRRVSSYMGSSPADLLASSNLGSSAGEARWSGQPQQGRAHEVGWANHAEQAGTTEIGAEDVEPDASVRVGSGTPTVQLGGRFERRASQEFPANAEDVAGTELDPRLSGGAGPLSPLADFFGTSAPEEPVPVPVPVPVRDSVRSEPHLVANGDVEVALPAPIRQSGRGPRNQNMNLAEGEGTGSDLLKGEVHRRASAREWQENQLL